MKGYIYKITSPSGKVYIGQTKNISNRKNSYKGFNTPSTSIKAQIKLYNSLSKYGWDNHKFEVIDECQFCGINNWLLDSLEIHWINEYDSFNNGLNCTKGGSGQCGHKHSIEAKLKMGNSMKGRVMSEQTKQKISNSNKGILIHTKRKPLSDETKQRISNSNKGRTHAKYERTPHSEETKQKMSNSQKGRVPSEETKKKISNSKKGTVCSEETKQKMSNSQKGRVTSEETKQKISSSHKGKKQIPHSEETKKKISNSLKSKKTNLNNLLLF